MSEERADHEQDPALHALQARRCHADVTPPVGIYARSWGAAAHDTAEGIHRPFAATAAVFAPIDGDGLTQALSRRPRLVPVRAGRAEAACHDPGAHGLDEASLLINMSHTHSGANVNSQLTDKPGAELIDPYIEHLTEQIGAAILEAREAAVPAWVTYGTGRCALATNRDLWDASAGSVRLRLQPRRARRRHAAGRAGHRRCGRGARDAGSTTPAIRRPSWENRLLSPDYIGAAREVLEQAFGAPALFFHAPRGPRPARRLRRRLGRRRPQRPPARARGSGCDRELAPAGTQFVYKGIVASGANLGAWEYQPCDAAQRHASEQLAPRSTVELQRKENIGVVESAPDATPDSVQEREKALRRRFLVRHSETIPSTRCRSGSGGSARRCWLLFQTSPTRLPGRAAAAPRRDAVLLVLGTTNRTMGYLSPEETYGTGLYQEQQSPFAPGCLEQTMIAAAALEEVRS